MEAKMTDIAAIYGHIGANKASHVQKIREFLQQPSVSDGDPKPVRQCAELLRQYYMDLGCVEADLVETGGHPAVWAFYDAGASKTLINYCMYDTQPVRVDEVWAAPPFDAEIVPGSLIGRSDFDSVMVARGAFNSKGPYRSWLNALESIVAVEGTLPVNIAYLAEGEEELGSPHLAGVVDRYLDRLRGGSAVLSIDAAQNEHGRISLDLGCKGNIYFEMECTSLAWARGARREVHGMMRSVLDSPVIHLIQAVASMFGPDGYTPIVDGLDSDIEPWAEDLELIQKLAADPAYLRELAEEHDVIAWLGDMREPTEILRRYFYGSNINVNGIKSGYTGPGAVTMIPSEAVCKVNIRLVPNQEPESVIQSVRRHLDQNGFSDIAISAPQSTGIMDRQYTGYTWAKTSRSSGIVRAALSTYEAYGAPLRVTPHSAGSGPSYLFNRAPLQLPICSFGLGHGGRQHVANEYLVLEGAGAVLGLTSAEQAYVDLLFTYAAQSHESN
jgi:acetylornithine deacetylase/succinyl-diaminopimelate desuccinylase-like protein